MAWPLRSGGADTPQLRGVYVAPRLSLSRFVGVLLRSLVVIYDLVFPSLLGATLPNRTPSGGNYDECRRKGFGRKRV